MAKKTKQAETLDALEALAQHEADRGDHRALMVVQRLRKVLEKMK